MQGYSPKYFSVKELVPPSVYAARGEKAIELFNPYLLETIDLLRDLFGQVIINTWFSKNLIEKYGYRSQSGIRSFEFYLDSAGGDFGEGLRLYNGSFSQHKYGNAVDCIFVDVDVEEVRQFILNNLNLFSYIKGLELGTPWLHIDTRNREDLITFGSNPAWN